MTAATGWSHGPWTAYGPTVREKREFAISRCVLPYHDRINGDPVAESQCAVYLLDAASSMTFATLSG
ncbi:hypothetical protein DLJ82_5050 (plasmid) [Rhizobium leguminosarum]|uniref:Uncharacterized protein n=1 Tax=Rhizobium leguminosarum TaxID=384 RepID=A0A2Z4YMY1_RHILE|nr:hypothetical protein DLJ82_5050 [Rhizobium leguminosarum]